MKRKTLKHIFNSTTVLITGLFYLAFSHFCLTYALVTGNPHHGVVTESASPHESDHHPHSESSHDHGNHATDDQHNHGNNKEDPCCLNLVAAVPVMSLDNAIDLKPILSLNSTLDILQDYSQLIKVSRIEKDHHPPGFFFKEVFLSPASLRAPPLI